MGEVVYDGPPSNLKAEVLTTIYGEEDWEATIDKVDDDDDTELDTVPLSSDKVE